MFNAIRLEHPSDGLGIFTSNDGTREELSAYNFCPSISERHRKFPTMPDEVGWNNYKEKFCAYKNLEQMKEWITDEEIQVILDKGFKIYLLDLSEATVTDYQVIFKREDVLQQKDITSMFQIK